MTKTFNVIKGDIVPPQSLCGAAIAHQCSDQYMSKIITTGGNEVYSICRYDFRDQKWRSPVAGLKQVIEYYTED